MVEDRPKWWERNEALKREMGIPAYEPPRFADGTYVHEVVDDIESRFDCSIRIVGHDTAYPDDWRVEVDDEDAGAIGRTRDPNGNTVYDTDAEAFRNRLRSHLEAEDGSS